MAMTARLTAPMRAAVRASASRHYAAQTALTEPSLNAPVTDPKPATVGPVQSGKLSNGIPVVSQDNSAVVGSIAIAVRAGSRQETASNAGVAHYLRSMAFQSTKKRTALAITRDSEARGIELQAEGDRELIVYSATFPKEAFDEAVATLADCVTGQAFQPWEIRDRDSVVELDVHGHEGLLEELHRGAFRSQLGRPYYCRPGRLGAISREDLSKFVDNYFTADRMAVVGYGVEQGKLLAAVKGLEGVKASSAADAKTKYFGGAEVRLDVGGKDFEAVLGFQGAGEVDKDAAAFDLLSLILSSSPALKWAGHSHARVNSALKNTGSASGFSLQYSDAGLVGVRLYAQAPQAGKVLSSAAAVVKQVLAGDITEADLARAKNTLGVSTLEFTASSVLSSMAERAVLRAPYATPNDRFAAIQAVTLADVKEAAKKAGASKPVLVVAGELDNVPYLDQL